MEFNFVAIPKEEWECYNLYVIDSHQDIIERPFFDIDHHIKYNVQMMPYNGKCWNLDLPDVEFTNQTIVVIEFTDYITTPGVPELKLIEKKYKERSNQVIIIHWERQLDYNGPLNLVYFPTHSFDLFNTLRKCRSEWNHLITLDNRIKWMSLNGMPKPHRTDVVKMIKDIPNGIISLGSEIPLDEWDYSSYKECNNVTNWMRLASLYNQAWINVINETKFSTPGIITEKTLFAFLALQIPLVIGHQGIVQEIRELGFDVFDDIVDTRYDNEPDDSIRMTMAINSNLHLLHSPLNVDSERLLNNQSWLLGGWLDQLQRDFNNSIQDILKSYPHKS